jgi:starch phosphorylase
LVGPENIFIFGLRADEVEKLKAGGYKPEEFIEKSPLLKEICDLIENNHFSPREENIFDPILHMLYSTDPFLVCADFDSYIAIQDKVAGAYLDKGNWVRRSIVNVSRAGKFSSDRAIKEYARDIWRLKMAGQG